MMLWGNGKICVPLRAAHLIEMSRSYSNNSDSHDEIQRETTQIKNLRNKD